jgi:dienelactone hydrolase
MLQPPDDTIEIPAADEAAVRGDLYTPPDRPPAGIVVLCHGFKGYKTWGFFPYLAGRLREAGLAALAIDFSLNGTFPEKNAAGNRTATRQRTRFTRPDLFRANTLEREIGDLAAVLRSIENDGLGGRIGRGASIGLFGHSRGGVSALLNALPSGRVRALCTWSTPDHPDRFSERQKAVWRRFGAYDFTDTIDGAPLSLSIAYLEDLEKNHGLYDLPRRVADLRTPYQVVHGEMDLAVPVRCAEALHDAARGLPENARRLVVLRTGHTFGVTDPPGMNADDPPRALAEASDTTVEWFGTYLKKGI